MGRNVCVPYPHLPTAASLFTGLGVREELKPSDISELQARGMTATEDQLQSLTLTF